MQELSLNILDIAQNCISAGASLVEIDIEVFGQRQEMLEITVRDDGAGMDRRTLQRVESPFFTSRLPPVSAPGLPPPAPRLLPRSHRDTPREKVLQIACPRRGYGVECLLLRRHSSVG